MVQMRCSILLRLSASAFCSVTAGGASRKEYWLVLGWYNCSKPVAVLKLWAGLATREIHPEKILNVIPNQFPSIFIPTFFHNVLYLWHHTSQIFNCQMECLKVSDCVWEFICLLPYLWNMGKLMSLLSSFLSKKELFLPKSAFLLSLVLCES